MFKVLKNKNNFLLLVLQNNCIFTESTKQSSIDNDKEKLVESLDSNERQDGHEQGG